MSDTASGFSPIQIAFRSKSRHKTPSGLILLTELPDQNVRDRAVGDVTVHAPNSNGTFMADRLRQALRHAGSQRAVSRKSGISERSITRFLSGQDVKTSDLVALADACGVSVEWLATGRGEMAPADSSPPGPTAPAPPRADPGLFATVNVDKLAGCVEAAQDVFNKRGQQADMRRTIQVALLLYDALDAPEADLKTLSQKMATASSGSEK